MQALYEDSTPTLKQLAEVLNVTQSIISERLDALRKIQKREKWVSYELKARNIEKWKTTCEILQDTGEKQGLYHRVATCDESKDSSRHPKCKKSRVDPG